MRKGLIIYMDTLYIAEKENVGSALANVLFQGRGQKKAGYITDGSDTVTWARGHLMGLADPEAYGPKYETWWGYDLFPTEWKKIPSKDASCSRQLAVIGSLLKKYHTVVNTGDPDREGQLLIDEILHHFQYRGTVNRLLINAVDDDSIRKALQDIQPNSRYAGLLQAGLGRERADWEVGMMLTRCFSKNAEKKAGWTKVLHIGRVKTPTLGLVVRREREIRDFHPVDFFVLSGTFSSGMEPTFQASFVQPDDLATDPEGRVLDRQVLDTIAQGLSGQTGTVSHYEKKAGKTLPPLPYSLDVLQTEANRKYHISPKEVLDTVESLYMDKYVSYPRSDCNFIPTSQFADAPAILSMLAGYGLQAASGASPSIRGRAFNDGKITAHHAIIPTSVQPSGLSDVEQKVYEMIALRYVLQFYPPYTFEKTNFEITIGGCRFKGSGTRPLDFGFKAVFHDGEGKDKRTDENACLPTNLETGRIVQLLDTTVKAQRTTPPKRFTQGTLLQAMTHMDKYMDPKDPLTAKMKEIKGLGTPATRDTIITELLGTRPDGHKTTAYLMEEKDELIPTEIGFALIDMLPERLSDPVETAKMELALDDISKGQGNLDGFMAGVYQMVRDNIQIGESMDYPRQPGMKQYFCPICKQEIFQRHKKDSKEKFWVCGNTEGHEDKKPLYFPDDGKDAPVFTLCPKCGQALKRGRRKDGSKFYYCFSCKAYFNDEKGRPVPQKPRSSGGNVQGSDEKCLKCSAPLKLIHCKDGKDRFHCDKCAAWYDMDKDGKPVPQKPRSSSRNVQESDERCLKCTAPLKLIHCKDGKDRFHCDKCGDWYDMGKDGKPTPQIRHTPGGGYADKGNSRGRDNGYGSGRTRR